MEGEPSSGHYYNRKPLKSLREVVEEEDLNYLRNAAAFEQVECVTRLSYSEGNIFHIAAYQNKVGLMDEAMKILPESVVQSLLFQGDSSENKNPLHVAAYTGYNKIVKLILDYYRSSEGGVQKPWLGQNIYLQTPLHSALEGLHQRTALEILSMDAVLLSNMEDWSGCGPLFIAVKNGYSAVALQILDSSPKCSFGGRDGTTALYFAPYCSEDVFKKMLERGSHMIIGQDSITKQTVLHSWVLTGILYPIEYVLSSNSIDSDLRRGFIDQLSIPDSGGNNPLHFIFSIHNDILCVKILQLLVNAYKQEREKLVSSAESQPPWLLKNLAGNTPLYVAINVEREELALYLFSLDPVMLLLGNHKLLFSAMFKKCSRLAMDILGTIQQNTGLMQLLTNDMGQSPLHYAPQCTEAVLLKLLETHPEFVTLGDDDESNILHSWIHIGELWPFKFMMERNDIDPQCRSSFMRLVYLADAEGRNPLHIAPTSRSDKDMVDIVQLLLKASYGKSTLWCVKDRQGDTPLELAVEHRQEKLALFYLSMDETLDGLKQDLLLKAAKKECHQVVKFLLEWTVEFNDKRFLKSNAYNILHVMQKSTDENWEFVVENFPELINEKDIYGKTPLDRCSLEGTSRLVELILKKDRSSIITAPYAWIEACNNGHLSTVVTLIDNSPYFRNICRACQDTPLHRLNGLTYTQYQGFLEHPLMKEFINFQNYHGKTPLHTAIANKDKEFAEVLLSMGEVDRRIKDNDGRTAMDLLIVECEASDEWRKMCEVIGVDPYLKTSYIRTKTDLKEMRSTISVVAALLATITFTAGFTMPGGLDSKGKAVLGNKAVFLVFLLSDSYSMTCSIMVLFCIIWSMVCERDDQSSLFIDRSLVLLKQSLYGTLLAFMTGVYGVIPHKSLWIAISVIIITSIVIVSASRSILYNLLKFIPAAELDYSQWLHFYVRGKKQEIELHIPMNQSEDEATVLNPNPNLRSMSQIS